MEPQILIFISDAYTDRESSCAFTSGPVNHSSGIPWSDHPNPRLQWLNPMPEENPPYSGTSFSIACTPIYMLQMKRSKNLSLLASPRAKLQPLWKTGQRSPMKWYLLRITMFCQLRVDVRVPFQLCISPLLLNVLLMNPTDSMKYFHTWFHAKGQQHKHCARRTAQKSAYFSSGRKLLGLS